MLGRLLTNGIKMRPVMDETIVMIHGMWGGGWCWDHYKSFYQKKGYRCITPTLRYHHMNPNDEPDRRLGTVSLVEYADDLEKLIRKLDSPVILMGHSMGGLLAQILASRILVDALVLFAPASPYGIMALTPSVVRSFWSTLTTWGFWKKPGRQTFKEASYSTLGVLPTEIKIEEFDKFVYESGRAVFEIGFWYFDSKKATMVDESKITCPVLIIAGSEDKITPTSVARKIADKYKEVAVYREFENHGHWVIGEPDWRKIAVYTSDWLYKVTSTKRFEAEAHIEQRKYSRTQHQIRIAFARSESGSFYQGVMLNFSQGGLHFTSDVKIKPGSQINLKWIDGLPKDIGFQRIEACRAEVRWYKQRDDDFSFDIGAQFYEILTQ